MDSIEEIKARLDIVDIVSETVQLKRSGKNYTGFCPFHPNTRTPSFVVWPETGTWRCFGQCNEGGDIFKFVMKREGWDFPEALAQLAKKAGVQLRPQTPQETAKKEEHARLRTLLEEAVAFYRHQLLNTESGKPALDYIRGRGLNDETIELFEMGYAPQAWDIALTHFLEKGYTQQDLLDVGLVSERDQGGVYDRFRNRVIIPIRDGRKRMAGFGARALAPDDMPKYLNSPQTVLFDKSHILYGLDKARRSIRRQDQVVIVEGYLGVIVPHQAGFTNVVASMGTALTEQQLRILKRLTRRMILALDSDAAGMNATMRGLQVARTTLDRESDLTFNARGLLHSEGRLNADIRVTTLPQGQDPDDVVNEAPEKWESLIEAAQPIVVHVMDTLTTGQDIDDPKVKTSVVAQVMPLIQDIPSAIERDTYVQQLARLLKVDERALVADHGRVSRQAPKRRRPTRMKASEALESQLPETYVSQPITNLEEHCISIIIRHPELLYRVDRALQQSGLPRISSEDFSLTNNQEIFNISLNALDQDQMEPLDFAIDNLPFPLLEYADKILAQTRDLDPYAEQVLADLLRSILRLREIGLNQSNNQLRFLMEDAQEGGTLRTEEYQKAMYENTLVLNKIYQALSTRMSQAFTG
ncbi:MAG: DNA primase [Anaerolineales bacterium]|jgi:DNA primase